MKNYLSIVILLFLGLSLNAQAPQGFNYQATVRNASGDLIVNQNVFFDLFLTKKLTLLLLLLVLFL